MTNNNKILTLFAALIISSIFFSCSRDVDELEEATFPDNGEVFIDNFSAGLEYAVFAGAKPSAFEVVTDVTYDGSDAAMRFAVPDVGDPEGAYAGGAFFTTSGRDLSGFTTLSFWAKASKAATIDVVGFGVDLGENTYEASLSGVAVNTNWQKYYIPIPDPSVLTEEKGMFYYSEGPEDERGYTFWIDEVKFENLQTIVALGPEIFNGEDVVITSETGDNPPLQGLSTVFSLPNGRNIKVNSSPAYFDFLSSDPSVATVNAMGVITVVDEGEATITAKLGAADASGSLTIQSTGEAVAPQNAAPTPDEDPADVTSIFSNAYTDVAVEFFNGFWEFSTTLNADYQVGNDDIIRYSMLNFVGIQFTSPTIDISERNFFHIDLWTPDATTPASDFKILLVDIGPDNSFGGNDDSSHEITITNPTLVTEEWISLDIPLSDFPGLTSRSNLAQIVLSSATIANVYVDNIYFYTGEGGGGDTEPDMAAPDPMQDAGNVLSIYSDVYGNLDATDFNPDWGQGTVVSEISIDGNNTIQYSGLDYQGIQLGSNVNVSDMDFVHIDYWTDNSSALNIYLISPGPAESGYALTVPTDGWSSVDIPLSAFAGVDLTDVFQFKFDGNGNIYWDNIYFWKDGGGGGATEPATAAPEPTQDAANVVSIFSDVYDDIAGTDFNPDWGQSTAVSTVDVAGDATLQYANFNYQGTMLAAETDLSDMEFIHIDMWTADATVVQFTPISASSGENLYTLEPINNGQWNSYDIPVSFFTDAGMTFQDIFQLKFDGQAGVTPSTIWLDNIYFWKEEGGGGSTEPTSAAPVPTEDPGNVVSIFSDAYDDLAGTDFNPNWGQSTAVSTVDVAGDATLQYANFNYQGTMLAAETDLSDMEFIHIDMWTADATVVQFTPISASSGENLYTLDPINSGQWNSYDIPVSFFTDAGMTFQDIFQLKFDGQAGVTPSTIWLDNIYFWKENGGGGGETAPAQAAAQPTVPAGDVISLFSDAYDDVPVDTWRTDWSAATLEDVMVEGNPAKKYSALDFVGIETVANQLDLSGMTHIHLDVWSADFTFFGIKLVDFGADGAFGGGDDVEHQINFEMPTQGEWISYDIPLDDFIGLTKRANMAQYILVGQPTGANTIYVDNVFFYK